MRQTGTNALAENVMFERGEYSKHTRHGTAG
jgi:hypothetical protein